MSGTITVECLTAEEASRHYGLDLDAEFCYVVVSAGFRIDGRDNEDPLPWRTAVVAQDLTYRGDREGFLWNGNWSVEFMEADEPQCRFPVSTLDDALRIAKDYCRTNRGQGVLL